MNRQIPINGAQPITEKDGTMTQVFRAWMNRVTDNQLIIGTGTPEGVIEAPQYSLYLDEAIPATPVQYRKMLSDIGGDITMGWAAL